MPAARISSSPFKYRNRITEYAGVKFHSKREAGYCAELDLRVRAKHIKSYRRQVPVDLKVAGRKICRLVVDYELIHLDGTVEYVEVKGVPTRDFLLKWKLFDALFPYVRKTIVK